MPRDRPRIGRRVTARAAARRPRRRRTPEVARQEILDAAERVFADLQPDQVGLKQIAREAGVSHALITHYFGTYAGLVEATLERKLRMVREATIAQLREVGALTRPSELLGLLFRTLDDPVHLRLVKWLIASERPAAAHAFALQERGIEVVARQIAAAAVPRPDAAGVHTLELTLLTAVAAAYGYAVSKHSLAGALGRDVTPELDREVQDTLAGMVQAYLHETVGSIAPPGAAPGARAPAPPADPAADPPDDPDA